jgi:hypothetical protein
MHNVANALIIGEWPEVASAITFGPESRGRLRDLGGCGVPECFPEAVARRGVP